MGSSVCARKYSHRMSEAIDAPRLPGSVSLALGTVATLALLSSADIRVLVIKGPALEAQGLRAPRKSADIDVIVAPDDFERALNALGLAGWSPRSRSQVARLVSTHSETLIHPFWPVDVDLHSRFPGMVADPRRVFDRLWDQRQEVALLGLGVETTSRAHSALIMALHALRDPRSSRMRQELEEIASRVEAEPRLRAEIAFEAGQLGAHVTAGPFLVRAGVQAVEELGETPDKEALAEWQARSESAAGVSSRALQAILSQPWHKRTLLVTRVLWPTAQDLYMDVPGLGRTRRARLRARIARLGRGIRQIHARARGAT